MTGRSVPVRTCVGCRERAPKSDLLRIVAVGDRLVPDPPGRAPGRGAHLHPTGACLDLAERRRAFPRALRLAGPLDVAALRGHLAARSGSGPERAAGRQEAGRVRDERSMSSR